MSQLLLMLGRRRLKAWQFFAILVVVAAGVSAVEDIAARALFPLMDGLPIHRSSRSLCRNAISWLSEKVE
jgi:hypothetical protein